MTKLKRPAVIDEAAVAAKYKEPFTVSIEIFGAEASGDPQTVFGVKNALPDDDDAERADKIPAVIAGLKAARDLANRLSPTGAAVAADVFGVYYRVFAEIKTAEPAHLEAMHRVARTIFGEYVDLDAVFGIFDNEFGSPFDV